MDNSEPAE